MEAGDDAAALEASLIENIARLDPDEVTQWETFTRLVKEGREVDDIAVTFGLPDPTIRRVLALGSLLPRIRNLYRDEKIDRTTVRHLTLASKSQQKAWLALHDDPENYTPTGHQLKAWLFGGQSIAARHALFNLDSYLTRKEARRVATGEAPEGPKPRRPELTSTLQTYVDLHRHAAVHAALLTRPEVALRLMVAHAIVGSDLWRVSPEPQTTRGDEVRESIETARGETVFDERRRAVLDMLGFGSEEATVI